MSNYRREPIAGGTYFFTLALANRQSSLLVNQIEALRIAYQRANSLHSFTTIAICIMPDHLHAIWQLPQHDANFALRWSVIKSQFSRQFSVNQLRSVSKARRREKGIWQRRFWEHQIRDEADLQRHVDYIHYNPVKHGYVKCVRDWEFSSFHRYVKQGHYPMDWGGDGVATGDFGEQP
jgi:putative transposase